MSQTPFSVEVYGCRGSIPTPLQSDDIRENALCPYKSNRSRSQSEEAINAFIDTLPQHVQGVIGGNTCCLHVRSGDDQLIIDAGSGLFNLAEPFLRKGLVQVRVKHIGSLPIHIWIMSLGYPCLAPFISPEISLIFILLSRT